MKGLVTLNKKGRRRLVVLNQVEGGRMGGRETGEVSGLSLRHVRRFLAGYDNVRYSSLFPRDMLRLAP